MKQQQKNDLGACASCPLVNNCKATQVSMDIRHHFCLRLEDQIKSPTKDDWEEALKGCSPEFRELVLRSSFLSKGLKKEAVNKAEIEPYLLRPLQQSQLN